MSQENVFSDAESRLFMMDDDVSNVSLLIIEQQMNLLADRMFIKTSRDLDQPIRSLDFERVQT